MVLRSDLSVRGLAALRLVRLFLIASTFSGIDLESNGSTVSTLSEIVLELDILMPGISAIELERWQEIPCA